MTKPLGGAEMQFVNKNVDTLEFNTKVIPFVFSTWDIYNCGGFIYLST